jgi:hypothetical protein
MFKQKTAYEMACCQRSDWSSDVCSSDLTGEIWRFGKLDRQQQQITQDMTLLRIPDDIEEIGHILVGILEMKD